MLTFLGEQYDEATNSFPKDIANRARANEDIVPKGDKKAMQKVMPFLQMVAAEVQERGKAAMSLTTPFNEVDVLTQNLPYIRKTLGLDEVNFVNAGTSDNKMAPISQPGKPSSAPRTQCVR